MGRLTIRADNLCVIKKHVSRDHSSNGVSPSASSVMAAKGPAKRSALNGANSLQIERAVRKSHGWGVLGDPGAAHQQLHHLLAHTPAVLYVLRIERENVVPILVSENIERLLGVSVTESMTYEWWLEYLHPEDRDRVVAMMADAFKTGGYSMEYRLRHKDGSYHWVQDNNRIVRGAPGKPRQIVGVLTDITERKRNEERLREQADIIEHTHDAVVVRDFCSDRITVWNNGAERLYGWSASEAVGQPLSKLFNAQSEERHALLRQILSTGLFHGEIQHRTKDGRQVIVDARMTFIRNEDGTPRAILGINTDVTEQKKLESHLLRAQRLESVGTLASGVSHDLNNVLAPIMAAIPILRGNPSDAVREKFLSIIESSVHRGADIVKQMLAFVRGSDADRILLQPGQLIDEVAKIAISTFPKSIQVQTSYPNNLRMVEADPTQLHQVLLNICLNARDAQPGEGVVSLKAENFDVDGPYAAMTPGLVAGPHVLINITDAGTGIPPHILDRIFDPFFTTKEVGHGSGLGLSTALGIVKSFGGSINVSSSPGGTTFSILLPSSRDLLPNQPSQGQGEFFERGEFCPGRGETILVVDDEEAIREVATAILEEAGYRVLTAEDGPAALACFMEQSKQIDAVLTDVVMPVMSGFALVRTLLRLNANLKVIVCTGQGSADVTRELEKMGSQEYLAKPYTRDALLRAVDRALNLNPETAGVPV